MTRRRCCPSSPGSAPRLIIQRAVEDEFDMWLGRARYQRRPNGPPGKRNGFRPRHVQTGEGELRIEVPQAREAAIPFVSKPFPKWHCKRLLRTDPLQLLGSAHRRDDSGVPSILALSDQCRSVQWSIVGGLLDRCRRALGL
jgi:hypothetical protein